MQLIGFWLLIQNQIYVKVFSLLLSQKSFMGIYLLSNVLNKKLWWMLENGTMYKPFCIQSLGNFTWMDYFMPKLPGTMNSLNQDLLDLDHKIKKAVNIKIFRLHLLAQNRLCGKKGLFQQMAIGVIVGILNIGNVLLLKVSSLITRFLY
jgi:hypothetical protein